MYESAEIAVNMKIEDIEELYGKKGILLAIGLLKKRLGWSDENYSMEEICSDCIHADMHSCCDTFCYCIECANNMDEDNIDRINGTCKKRKNHNVYF